MMKPLSNEEIWHIRNRLPMSDVNIMFDNLADGVCKAKDRLDDCQLNYDEIPDDDELLTLRKLRLRKEAVFLYEKKKDRKLGKYIIYIYI